MNDKEVKTESVSIEDANTDNTQQNENTTPAPDTIIESLQKQIAELNDKYLRAVAELENTRRRAALDIESVARGRAMSVAENLLPVMDAVESALKHAPDDIGIQSLGRAIQSAFDKTGITKIETVGHVLNPKLHNAIQIMDAPTDATPRPAPNTILEEMQSGYMFGDNVLRTAMVVVCK